ncbi:KxYKxGKxW signal peptide domain-containing protein, partial [Weissella confusa]|uniref:KxYKxGKxW signal peptide domain-containing protein n=1 Tax=Weissella confusa TaxID=1583 RepID=UPI0018989AB4
MEKIKEHYKLYKSGKFLLTAGLMTVTATVSVMGNVHADEAQAVTPDTSLEQAGLLAEAGEGQLVLTPAGQDAAPVSEDTSPDDSERTTPTVANNYKPAIDSVDTSQPATAAPKADTDVSTLQVDSTTKTDSDIKEDTPTDTTPVVPVAQAESDTPQLTSGGTNDTKTVQLTTVEGTSKQVVTTPKEESSTDKSSSVVSKQTDKTSLPTVATATATTVSKIPSVTGDYQFDEKTKTYTFTGKDGQPVTGLVYANNILQYFDETGHQVKGQYVTIAGHVYYFDPASGAAQTGVNQIDGKMVGFKSDGSQITSGFSNDNAGNSYYFDESGTMVTGLQTIAGKTYYFDKDGHLRKGYSTIIDNQLYYFDLKTGESVSTTTSNFKSGLTSQTDDTTPHNSAVNMSKDSFTTVDGFLTAESWYVPKDIQTSATDWRASTPEDFRPIMMTWWPTKQIQAAYLNH